MGLFCGILISAGLAGFIVGLAIIPTYAVRSHTTRHIFLYENISMLGILFGNSVYLFHFFLPGKNILLGIMGFGFGFFLGAWILADIFPALQKRLSINNGYFWILLSLAVGKSIGALLYFYSGWQ